jgi:predicted DNA-binding transcriptional regulator YafY
MKLQSSPRHLERLTKLDELIRSPQPTFAKGLAEALEVSPRTISDDIAFLKDRFNAPIATSNARGYYYTDSDWRLSLVPLSQGELFALVLGSRMLDSAAGAAYASELQSAIDQLVRRMPDQTWADLKVIIEERIQFGSGGLIDFNPVTWKTLIEASHKKQVVEMTYYTASEDTLSTRKFDPYLMYVYRGTNPYSIGYCHRRQAIRVFRVDRIREIRRTDETFVQQADFNRQEYLDKIFQIEAGGEPQEVQIRFSKKVAPFIRERRWHPTQSIEEHPDGALTLHMRVPGLTEVMRWVMGYGGDAIVEGCPELVEMIRLESAKMAGNYQ